MKLIRYVESKMQTRPDGRTVRKMINKELGVNFSNIQFLYVVHPERFMEKLHSHERSYEILYFLDKAKYKINGKDYDIDEKDMIILEPGDIHGAIFIENQVRILVVQVPAITEDKKIHE
ncbi:hypothetical protein HYT25_01785 [Candidatus Pacearchaeota archaeon]|nr:hypothetical protein [Candidatus Pacearchaeota archaeon]